MAVTERSPLLRADPSRTGRRIRVLVSGLVLVLLLAGIVTCIAIVARYLRGSPTPVAPITPLMMAGEFDAIVIGGGPAGSVVSRLLSDDPWRRVLLVEAGNASQTQVGGKNAVPSTLNFKGLTPFDIPYYWTNVANTPSLHWAYPDVNIAKALGGCGIHNAMLYVRPLPTDLERWKMDKWTWEKTLEIYMDIEDFDGPNSSYHSTRGFLRTSPAGLESPLSNEFVEACEQIGIQRTEDFNAPGGRVGAGFYHFNTRDGVRESAVKAFLDPIVDTGTGISTRKNFQLLTDTTVTDNAIDDHLIPRVVSEVPENEPEHLREGDLWKITWAIGVDEGVVDDHLQVFGIKNLRVADASVIPFIPNGNVHSSVVMVANRAVQILREDEHEERRVRTKHSK
ncbi:hypothetical protein BBJ29_002492 [Phytophthora kernoviae]|uniref:Glucose-methanol-choline oxidoreductase N-terminal domain-containing protein n=1 Tax=Phytophthora kernoviae TaxID=325452 RepID=A0A3F2RP58_9STRA|nr:hypothetical protein BBJ29_002492 [Phytophthora kernoviae]RLN61529.1 hypothetical protein BBP00_00005351 [Phytophthora kernoviae]